MPIIVLLISLIVSAIAPASLSAQEAQVEQPRKTENFAAHFLKDQSRILGSPFKVKRSDVKWLLPLGAGAAALLATDRKVAEAVDEADNLRPASRVFSKFGGGAPTMIASVSLFGIGKLARNEKAADTGKLAVEAVLHTQLVTQGLKLMFNRERPNKVGGYGGFWDGGRSFPSGHAATSFAFATVVASRYKEHKLVVIGTYGLATAVSMSRIGGMNHHPSDVLVGGLVGHLIGRYILHRHPVEN